MEFMKSSKSEEVVFGKGFVPMLAVYFTAADEEIRHFSNLKKAGKRIHIVIDPAGTASVNGEETQSFKELLTGALLPETLPADGASQEESAFEPICAQRPRWRPAYQLAAASLLVTLALGLFILAISDRAPFWETKGKATGTIIAEKDSIVSVLARQNQNLMPVRGKSLKSERPQRLAHNKRSEADTDALLLKQDAAWRALWR